MVDVGANELGVSGQVEGAPTEKLGDILDRMQSRRVFLGHPAETPGGEQEAEMDASSSPGEEQKEVQSADTGKSQEEDTAADQSQEASEDYSSWGFKPKYRNHLEAEIGYREAERKMHEATQAAAALKAEVERLRQEMELLKQGHSREPVSESIPAPEVDEQVMSAYEKALAEINELDPYDPDYQKLAAKAWAKAGIDRVLLQKVLQEVERRLSGAGGPQPVSSGNEAGTLQAPQGQAAPVDMHQHLVQTAEAMAKAYGLDMTPGSVDHRLFWSNLNHLPQGLSLEEEVRWMTNETKKLKAQLLAKEGPQASNIHTTHSVLERGSEAAVRSRAGVSKETIESLLEKHRSRRVI